MYDAFTVKTTAFIRFFAAVINEVALSSCGETENDSMNFYHPSPEQNSYAADNQFTTDILHIRFDFARNVQLMAVERDA